ncbi:hypothetical protein KIPB_008800 [Kipferlia bialata]|uniref:Uncharacterized protein n=1 Tax=Kipferlia bialata TaxID=797122 RepID=A0A391NNR1_9EUKA|nr:hypothetical protein KIPB_008800 [Kipferlia bialata]|eukprot:g8800.t1
MAIRSLIPYLTLGALSLLSAPCVSFDSFSGEVTVSDAAEPTPLLEPPFLSPSLALPISLAVLEGEREGEKGKDRRIVLVDPTAVERVSACATLDALSVVTSVQGEGAPAYGVLDVVALPGPTLLRGVQGEGESVVDLAVRKGLTLTTEAWRVVLMDAALQQ